MNAQSFTGLIRSWRGVPISDRLRLLRLMANRIGAPVLSVDGTAVETCLYCPVSAQCQNSFEGGDGTRAEKLCPNVRHLRAPRPRRRLRVSRISRH